MDKGTNAKEQRNKESGWVGVEVGGVLDSSKIWSGEDRGTLVKF